MTKHVVTSAEYAQNSKLNGCILGAMYVVIGLIIAILGQDILNFVVLAIGVMFAAYGILAYAETKVINVSAIPVIIGVICIILGLYGAAAGVIRVIFAIILIISGLGTLAAGRVAIPGIQNDKTAAIIDFIVAGVTIILGVVCLFNFGDAFGIIVRAIGVVNILTGVLKIVQSLGIIR